MDFRVEVEFGERVCLRRDMAESDGRGFACRPIGNTADAAST